MKPHIDPKASSLCGQYGQYGVSLCGSAGVSGSVKLQMEICRGGGLQIEGCGKNLEETFLVSRVLTKIVVSLTGRVKAP